MLKGIYRILRSTPSNSKKYIASLSFLRLRNEKLILFQWIGPTAFSASLFVFVLNPCGSFFEFDFLRIFEGVNGLLGVLVGFYIAALAATATFPSANLDKPLSGNSATTLSVRRKGSYVKEEITRRRYMSMIFGYCAFQSIMIFLFGLLQVNIRPAHALPSYLEAVNFWLFSGFWFIYIWAILSLLSATLVGLYYLVDRMHRE